MRRKYLAFIALASFSMCMLAGCGGKAVDYADGTYTGKSSVYETDGDDSNGNGYGVVTITIKDNKITACTYETYEPDGTLKDSSYGMQNGEVANRDYYNKAQKAIAACEKYAEGLVNSNDISEVDAISGATINYDNFTEAVNDALKQAEIK